MSEMPAAPAKQENFYRPWLQVAVFCEKVLREADNVLSIIRIIDRFNVRGTTRQLPPTPLRFCMVLAFKSGFMRGKGMVRIQPSNPSGTRLPAMELPILFEGDDERGAVIAAEMTFVVEDEGVYWFDVSILEELITRMPLRVVFQQTEFRPTAG